jgi:hypothetical protein
MGLAFSFGRIIQFYLGKTSCFFAAIDAVQYLCGIFALLFAGNLCFDIRLLGRLGLLPCLVLYHRSVLIGHQPSIENCELVRKSALILYPIYTFSKPAQIR